MNNRISSENISSFYCPECQEIFSGEGFIEAIGTKVFSFGCKDCRDKFIAKYSKINQ